MLAPSCRSRIFFHCLALFSSLVTTVAFTPSYSPATQCGSFTVNWASSNGTTGPPFVLLILPLDAPPTILRLPDSSFDATTKTGKYTLDKLPLKSGTQFVVAMDDGYGRGTGGVTLLQTVGASSDASCLAANVSSMSSFFTLNPPTPSQCSTQTVAWNSTRYRQPPEIRGFIPGGQAFTLDRPTSNSTTQQDWDVHIREGTQMVFLVQPAASNQNMTGNSDARTSPLVTVTGKSSQGDACLGITSPSSTVESGPSPAVESGPSSTVESAPIGTIPTVPGSTDPSGNVKVAAITGGIVGGLGLIAIICASIVLYRSLTRKDKDHPHGLRGASYDGRNQPRSRTFNSSRNGVLSTTGERSWAGVTIASTQVSGGTRTGHQTNAVNEFGTSLGDGNGTGENSSTLMVPPNTISATPMRKPHLNVQGQTAYPPQRSRSAVLPPSPSPIVSVTDDALSDRWEDTSVVYGAPMVNEKRTGFSDVPTLSRTGSFRDVNDRNPGREPERHEWSSHPYANPLAAANPTPSPVQRSNARSPSSPTQVPSISVWGEEDDGDRNGNGNGNRNGDQAVNEEYAFESRRGLSMRARMDGSGNVYGSRRNRSRENEIGTEYVRHTDAGAVRVVELPPLYNELRR